MKLSWRMAWSRLLFDHQVKEIFHLSFDSFHLPFAGNSQPLLRSGLLRLNGGGPQEPDQKQRAAKRFAMTNEK